MRVPEWTTRAKCAGMDTEDWYPPRERGTYKVVGDRAKAVCKGTDGNLPCPVRLTCLGDAFDREEQFGIFGGLSNRERNALRRKAETTGVSWEQLTLTDRERGLQAKAERDERELLEGTA